MEFSLKKDKELAADSLIRCWHTLIFYQPIIVILFPENMVPVLRVKDTNQINTHDVDKVQEFNHFDTDSSLRD